MVLRKIEVIHIHHLCSKESSTEIPLPLATSYSKNGLSAAAVNKQFITIPVTSDDIKSMLGVADPSARSQQK